MRRPLGGEAIIDLPNAIFTLVLIAIFVVALAYASYLGSRSPSWTNALYVGISVILLFGWILFVGPGTVKVAFVMVGYLIAKKPDKFQAWVNNRAARPRRVKDVAYSPYQVNIAVVVLSKAAIHEMPPTNQRPETLRPYDRIAIMEVGDETGRMYLIAARAQMDRMVSLEVGQKLSFHQISHTNLHLPFADPKRTEYLIYDSDMTTMELVPG